MPDIKSHHEQAIDGLLDELSPEQIFFRMHERQRKREHAKAKLAQPKAGVSISDADWKLIVDDFTRPITEEDRNPQGIDYLVQTVLDCVNRADREDALFAALRVVRRVWAMQPHLGEIKAP